jgi:tetratricopeptide (TPR) repeat protein
MMEQLVDTNRSLPDLGSIQEMVVAKRFDDALTDLAEIFRAEPDNPDALYMAAVCCRYTHDFKSALEHIGKLKTISPEHGRAHQEEGHTYRDMGHPDDALLAYSRACRFNPALTASWRGQLEILRRKGLDRQAAQVTAQIEALQALPRPLLAALDLIGQRKLIKAEDICRQFLRKVPHHVEGMRLLADIGVRLGVLEDAEFLLSITSRRCASGKSLPPRWNRPGCCWLPPPTTRNSNRCSRSKACRPAITKRHYRPSTRYSRSFRPIPSR